MAKPPGRARGRVRRRAELDRGSESDPTGAVTVAAAAGPGRAVTPPGRTVTATGIIMMAVMPVIRRRVMIMPR